MRMYQLCVCGEPLRCNEEPTPEPKGTEVLLKVLAVGVCHSDLHLADGYSDLGSRKCLSLADRGNCSRKGDYLPVNKDPGLWKYPSSVGGPHATFD